MEKFYVYQLRLETSILPFYIGKGCGERARDHFKPSQLSKNTRKNNMIKRAISEGVYVNVEVVHENISENEAHSLERELISKYKRMRDGGCLTNSTIGGEGTAGWNHSDTTKKKMSLAKLGKRTRPRSETEKKNISDSLRGRKRNPISVKKAADTIRGRKHDDQARFNMSKSKIGKSRSADSIRASRFGAWKKNPAWKRAGEIYETWNVNGRPGYVVLAKLSNESARIAAMHRSFLKGWVPSLDHDWVSYSNSE